MLYASMTASDCQKRIFDSLVDVYLHFAGSDL